MSLTVRLVAAGVTGALLAGSLAATTPATAAGPAPARTTTANATPARTTPGGDVTSAPEARRVDRVPTPAPAWYACYGYAQCATVRVPLDYDEPHGATVELAMLRVKARKPKNRIGTLFVNPGGPGGSGIDMAAAAPDYLGDTVLDRFDVVGFDPRGIGASENIRCFATTRESTLLQAHMNIFFPNGATEEAGYIRAAKTAGRACSSTGATLAGAMSTAQAARDMDVLRRAVGDKKLTYLGFSYGTALGQYYANMFPDRVRALALDGVINPLSWIGLPATQDLLLDDRLRSADAAYRALHTLLVRCDQVGLSRCPFAAGDPNAHFAAIARTLRAKPLVLSEPGDSRPLRLTYADFVGVTLSGLYSAYAGEYVTGLAYEVERLLATQPKVTEQQRAAARRSLRARLALLRPPTRDFYYDNSLEAYAGVICTDALHPADASWWPVLSAAEDARAPYFGRAWSWSTAQCARSTWTVRDEDAYRGPFNKHTATPVLLVGSFWDPATSYRQAVSVARLLPNSRLLSSDNWGHTGYGTSTCVTSAVDDYLVRGALPPAGTTCHSPIQPFTETIIGTASAREAGRAKSLPPVAGPFPIATLVGALS